MPTQDQNETQYFLGLAANQPDRAIIVTDTLGLIVYVNSTFTTMFGYTAEEVLGRQGAGILSEQGEDEAVGKKARAEISQGRSFHDEIVAYDKAGNALWMSTTMTPVFDEAGRYRHLCISLSNITESKRLQGLQRDVLEAVANDLPVAEIMDLLCRRVEAIAPEVVCSVLGIDDEGCIRPLAGPSLPPNLGRQIDGVQIGPMVGSCGSAAYHGEPQLVEDIDTDPRWASFKQLVLPFGLRACWSSPIKLRDGRVGGTFAFYYREVRGPSVRHEHIVTACVHLCMVALERHLAKAHIAKLAYFDALTGLPNRTRFNQTADEAIASAQAQTNIAFLFLDLDRFKDVNDTLGHSVGDALLVEVARRLKLELRAEDIVSRQGGDEFVAMLPDCDAAKAATIAKRILSSLAEPVLIEGSRLPVSVSLGISLYPGDGGDAVSLVKHADAAMYDAKNAGRGTFRFFAPQMNALAQERLKLGAALRDAVSRGLLHLAYQPQVCAKDGSLHGLEALARWHSPIFGEVPPSRFIPLAEELGLIEAIGDWALDTACAQMADWRARGVRVGKVSVNLSPLHFRNRDLFDDIRRVLEKYRLEPAMLTVEITESVMVDDVPAVLDNAWALRALGVGLSMDDFGTGYSSLAHLARLPVNEVKIDRSFIRDIETDRNGQALVTAVARIGQSLGLNVVAEGVETHGQRRFLSELGCPALQGFLFAPGLLAADFEHWLGDRYDADPMVGAA